MLARNSDLLRLASSAASLVAVFFWMLSRTCQIHDHQVVHNHPTDLPHALHVRFRLRVHAHHDGPQNHLFLRQILFSLMFLGHLHVGHSATFWRV
ncbi:hypothetical protein F5148DRAFT_1240274 [Russula earlei]|uniref:Uncharacterized protein n=1 Tax=Russula earlei TaxID=71964 RepID=A0ACC0TWS9_9AGAM|nr:hypothetical protein F5148DRAFT_1240274 [Russula earlei]